MATDIAQLREWITVITVPFYFFLAFAIHSRKLSGSYHNFWICLLVEGGGAMAGVLTRNSPKYATIAYLVMQPPIFLLYILMVLEVFQKVFIRFPGIAKFAQKVVLVSLVLAAAFSISSLGGDLGAGWMALTPVARYGVILRAISSALCLFMMLISLFLLWMPVPLPPNTIRHSFLFFFYFMVTSGVYYVLNLSGSGYAAQANLITGFLTLGALFAWYWLLQPEGELTPVVRVLPQTPAADLIARLEALNRTLSRPQE